MTWRPTSLEELVADMAESEERMDTSLLRLWAAIRLPPAKWQQEPWGNEGGGFWVVGVFGSRVLWYNDIEEGFNISEYSTHGVIDRYSCEQQDLRDAVLTIQEIIADGEMSGTWGAPESVFRENQRPRLPSG